MVWVTPREAAAELHLSLAALYKAVQRGRIPAYRLGRLLRFRPADLKVVVRAARPRRR